MDVSGDTPIASIRIPVCERCRSHRVKCDKGQPTCGRCAKAGLECQYVIKDAAAVFANYVSTLENEVALLEQEMSILQQQVDQMEDHQSPAPSASSHHSETPSHGLFHSLSNVSTDDGGEIDDLINEISQVSLTATTAHMQENGSSSLFGTLVLGSALTSYAREHYRTMIRLPPQSVSEKVMKRYVEEILPYLPLIDAERAQFHFEKTDKENTFASFCIATIIATTALHFSAASFDQSVSVYLTGLDYLKQYFDSDETDPLYDLEAVLLLAQYASIAGNQIADACGLSGIAMRVCIDLGLHKFADSDRKRRLFWSAYALDRSVAIALNYPFGLSDCVINVPLPASSTIFNFRVLQSKIHEASTPILEAEAEDYRTELEYWHRTFQNGGHKSDALELEYQSTIRELKQKVHVT